jgi:hypothetical protein
MTRRPPLVPAPVSLEALVAALFAAAPVPVRATLTGPGRRTIFTIHDQARRGKYGRLGHCSGAAECERRRGQKRA